MSPENSLMKVVWQQNYAALLVILLLSLSCIGFYLASDQYIEPEVEGLRLEQAALRQQLHQQRQRVTKEGMPVSAAERMAEDLDRFRAKVPSKVKFADFIGDLFAWAEQTSLQIRQVSYQPKIEPESGFLKYSLNFSVQGDYGQLKNFIYLLENSTRILIIDSIALSGKADNASEKNVVSLNIKLSTYFQEKGQ